MPIDFRDNELARSLIQEGRAEGRQEGRQEGWVEGRASLIRAVLLTRFGDNPRIEQIATRLQDATDQEIASLLNASDLDDF